MFRQQELELSEKSKRPFIYLKLSDTDSGHKNVAECLKVVLKKSQLLLTTTRNIVFNNEILTQNTMNNIEIRNTKLNLLKECITNIQSRAGGDVVCISYGGVICI